MNRPVHLFRDGENRAVRIPREFELPGTEAVMRREGDRLIIELAVRPDLLAVLAALNPLDEADWPEPVGELPLDPIAL